MPLSDIQFNKALRTESLEILREGLVPSIKVLTERIQKRLGKDSVTPTLKVRRQTWREKWDLAGMNTCFKETAFDLDVMYSSYLELAGKVLRRLNLVDVSSRAQHSQIDRIESVTRNLLFIIQNGDAYFDGFFDDLHDLSKVDSSQSTKDIVDLSSQTVELPHNFPNTRRISLDHLSDETEWKIDTQADSQVIKSETPSDAPFKNMFIDTISMWRHDVITSESGPISISFTIPVHKIAGGELTLTRVQLVGMSAHLQRAEVLYSVDGVNFLKFYNNTETVELAKSSKVTNIDFPSTRVEFLKITLFRSSHDRVLPDNTYITSFGLKNLSLYSLGRAFEGQLVSKPFFVSDPSKSINKVSVSVSEEIPKGTSIQYYIGPIDKEEFDIDEPEVNGTWIPITPLNRPSSKDEPTRVIRMSSLSKKKVDFIPSTPLDPIITHKGVKYYQLNASSPTKVEQPIAEDVVFKSALLHRGKNAWMRKSSSDFSLLKVSNDFISFSSGPRQKLYTTAQEVLSFGPALTWNGVSRSTIEVSRPIDYRPHDGMSMVAKEGTDPYTVPDPVHAVYEVTLTGATFEDYEDITFASSGTPRVAFTKGPIEIAGEQDTLEYYSAYRADQGTFDSDLMVALESRTGLQQYHDKIIKGMSSISTAADVAAGKPQITKFTIGNSGTGASTVDFTVDGEIVQVVKEISAQTKKSYANLSDDQVLGLFGKIKFKTSYLNGVTGYGIADPTKTYKAGIDFQLFVINDPTTNVPALYVARTASSTISAGEQVRFKFRYKRDLTRHVLAVQGQRIYMDKEYSIFKDTNMGYRVKVGYRYVPVGIYEVLKESLVVTAEPSGDRPYLSGKDYYFNPRDGSITLIPSGKIKALDGKLAVYASFTHKGPVNNLETYSTWVFSPNKNPIKIHYPKLEVNTEFGEKILINTGRGSMVDISNTTESPEIEYGWHQVQVHSRNPDVYTGTAIRKAAELKDDDDNPVFMAGGLYFSEMRGSRVPLTQVPYDFLLNSVLPNDYSKFCIDVAGRVLVNFQPNSQESFYTYGYRTEMNQALVIEDVADFYDEEFTLEYDYHREEAKKIEGVVLKAYLRRDKETDPGISPKILGFQIRVG